MRQHTIVFIFTSVLLFIITIKKRAYVDQTFLFGQLLTICHRGAWLSFLILAIYFLVFLSYSRFNLQFYTSLAYLFVFLGQVIHNFLLLPLTEN